MTGDEPSRPRVRVLVMPHARGLELPRYETPGAAGLDLRAAVDAPVTIEPGGRELVPTGLKVQIPLGFEGQIRARSGLAHRHGIGLPNAPGTIDADYRGEILVSLVNWSRFPFEVSRGDRVAQLVIAPVARAVVVEVESLEETARESGGFGHTGVD